MSFSCKTFLLTLFYCLTTVFYSSLAVADSDTKKLIAGYGSSEPSLNALAAKPNDALVVPEGNAQALFIRTPGNPLGTSQTEQKLADFFALTPGATSADDIITNIINHTLLFGAGATSIPTTASLYAGCSTSLITGGGNGLSSCLLEKQAPPLANVDINTLISPLVFQKGQEKTAENFISAVAGLSNPYTPIDLNKIAERQNTDVKTLTAHNPQVIQYLALVRAYAAVQSVGLGNLYQLYAERMPSKVDPATDKDLAAALSAIDMPNASQLQVENYMATRRILDPQWVSGLIKDSPAALLRQIVILLAENLAESYNNRLASERILATMSVLDLQQAAMMRTLVLDQAGNDLNRPPQAGK